MMRLPLTCVILLVLGTACVPDAPEQVSESIETRYANAEPVLSPTERVSSQQLQQIFQSEDELYVSEKLNDAKRAGVSREGLQFLLEVWLENIDAHPGLAWGAITETQTRLDIVDILVQATKNREMEAEPSGAHEFVRRVVARESARLASQGLITLAAFDRNEDVAIIEAVALRNDPQTFRSAVIALSTMCVADAEAALFRIESASSGPNQDFAKTTRERMAEYKQRTRACQ